MSQFRQSLKAPPVTHDGFSLFHRHKGEGAVSIGGGERVVQRVGTPGKEERENQTKWWY